jgi:tRNA(Ile)-lysidine synthase
VRRAATALSLPFESTELRLGAGATETRAREARYPWLRKLARERKAWLFTAHHRDDQVETVLMRFFKGSGPAGLAGIAPVSGKLVRPLLPFGCDELHTWLEARGVASWNDPANRDPRHLRSWLRAAILPAARARVPALDRRLLGLAQQAATDRAAWDAVVDLLGLAPERDGEGFRFDARPLRELPPPLVEAVFLAVARRYGHTFGARSSGRVRGMSSRDRSGSRVNLTGGWEARLQYGWVSVRMAPLVARVSPPSLTIEGESGTAEWDGWRISWSPGPRPGQEQRVTDTAWLEPATYTVRAWRPGDRIHPLGGTGSRLVVRCMQDVRLPASERAHWPVVGMEGALVWVPRVCRSNRAIARDRGVCLRFARLEEVEGGTNGAPH